MKQRLLVTFVLMMQVFAARGASPHHNATFPGKQWTATSPESMGWSASGVAQARRFFDSLPPASLFVIDRGTVVLQWGDPALKIKISSMRKSILSELYGIHVAKGDIDLDKTMAQLGVDDDPPLTEPEKQATVRMLLEARSGIYHSYVAGTPAMRERAPVRGSHAPGTFWYYNNWDFNALGAIFEEQTHAKIGEDFRRRIANPTHMQDFLPGDMYYLHSRPDSPAYERSRFPAYHFRLSARDLGRFGYLMLRSGTWNGKQVIPASWVRESTQTYSDTGGAGYGYLWWINDFGLPVKSFSAEGALAKYVVVIPERDLVAVYLNHTEFPDDASQMKAEELKALPNITDAQMSHMLQLLLNAQRPTTDSGKK